MGDLWAAIEPMVTTFPPSVRIRGGVISWMRSGGEDVDREDDPPIAVGEVRQVSRRIHARITHE